MNLNVRRWHGTVRICRRRNVGRNCNGKLVDIGGFNEQIFGVNEQILGQDQSD
jgi:hypothetical protein